VNLNTKCPSQDDAILAGTPGDGKRVVVPIALEPNVTMIMNALYSEKPGHVRLVPMGQMRKKRIVPTWLKLVALFLSMTGAVLYVLYIGSSRRRGRRTRTTVQRPGSVKGRGMA
jgi:hypothetical protein